MCHVISTDVRDSVILIAVIRLQYVERQIESDNPTLVGATATVLTQTELFYSVVAATIPCLRPFLAAFVTNYGAMGGDTILGGSYVISAHHKESKGSGASFAMRSLDSAKRAANRSEKRPVQQLPVTGAAGGNADTLRPDQVSNRISAGHGKGHHAAHDASSVGSDESTRGMIIKKEVAWQVDSQSWRTRSHHGVQPGQER